LRAIELQRKEEEEDRDNLKVRIMEQAALMQYDDDFDDEAIFSGAYTGKSKY